MRKLFLAKLGLVIASLAGVAMLSGCQTPNMTYRNYYQDASCRLYYVDYNGNRVYSDGPSRLDYVGRPMHRDCNGRLYWEDSFGNRMYRTRLCR